MKAFERRRLVRSLSAPDDAARWEAAKALSAGADPRTLKDVTRVLERSDRAEARVAAAYVLGFSGTTEQVDALVGRLVDAQESTTVRAYAAEALGHLLQHRSVLAETRLAIGSALRDPEPEVRFWSAFAAGALELHETRQQLERLVADRAVIEGWWTVGEEAEWALACLDGDEDPALPERR